MAKKHDSRGIPWKVLLSAKEQLKLLDVKLKEDESGRPDRKGARTYLPRRLRLWRDDEPSFN